MKLSELLTDKREAVGWDLPHPASSLADPPITLEEARKADTAICRFHNGSIAHSPTPADVYGKAYFCPVGGSYWRYSKQDSAFYGPLPYLDDQIV